MIYDDNCIQSNFKDSCLHNEIAEGRCLTREEVLMLEST